MRLGLEKARQREKGRVAYDPIASFRPPHTPLRKLSKKQLRIASKMRRGKLRRLRQSRQSSSYRPEPLSKRMTLIVKAPHYTASSTWIKLPGQGWRCAYCEPDLVWMQGMLPDEVLHTLRTIGATWKWSNASQFVQQAGEKTGKPDLTGSTSVPLIGNPETASEGMGNSSPRNPMLPTGSVGNSR